MNEISAEQLDRIGRIADKADNLLAVLTLYGPPLPHLQGCKSGLEQIKVEAWVLYRELGGEE